MSLKKLLPYIFAFLALTGLSHGAVKVSETFAYGTDTALDNTTAGGTGWVASPAGYYNDAGLTTSNVDAALVGTDDGITWTFPAGYGVSGASTTQSLEFDTGLATGASPQLFRGLNTGNELATGSVLYFSYIFEVGLGNITRVGFGTSTTAGHQTPGTVGLRYDEGSGSNGRIRIHDGAGFLGEVATGLGPVGQVLVVGKMDYDAGTISARLYGPGDTIDASETWDVTYSTTVFDGTVYSNIVLWVQTAGTNMGNIFVGDTWEDVVGPQSTPYTVLASETFSYGLNEPLTNTTAGGTGWDTTAAGYYSDSGLTAPNANTQLVGTNNAITWTFPAGYGVAGASATDSFQYKAGALVASQLFRGLDTGNELATGSVLYFSYIFEVGLGNNTRFGFGTSTTAGHQTAGTVGLRYDEGDGSNGRIRIHDGAGFLGEVGTGLGPVGQVLVVGKMDYDAGTISAKVYGPSDTINASEVWDTTVSTAVFDGTVYSNIVLWVQTAGTNLGNIFIGDSWEAVVGPQSGGVIVTATLEMSTDLENWITVEPGEFNTTLKPRFFRARTEP